MNEKKIDVIVVGAGPAGVSAGITLARANKKVLIVERGSFAGAKNVFGGAVYVESVQELFPNFLQEAPIERFNHEHKYALLTQKEATTISYKSDENRKNSCTVIRSKFDKWCVEQAQKEGAFFAPNTVVRELIIQNNKVVGIKTDLEEYYANIVIIADGVNSLLAKQLNLRKKIQPKNVALAIKEVIKLDKAILEERLNLTEKTGCIYEFIGYPMDKELGLGFLYTNKDSISIGLGIGLEDLKQRGVNVNDVLEELKSHPIVAPIIKNGELLEYSAHLIPEGGYKNLPKLYDNGVMVVGDAAMLVNNIHWEGTNLAFTSGKLAAQTAIEALNKNDFSSKTLKAYEEKLKKSYVIKDLKTYKNVLTNISPRTQSFFGYWPKKIAEFFKIFTTVNAKPKKQEFRRYICSWFKERPLNQLISDIFTIIKSVIGVLK